MSNIPINLINNDFQCKYCLKNYSYNYNLNRHLKQCKLKEKNDNLLNKFQLYNNIKIKKYINNFYNLTIFKYFEENKFIILLQILEYISYWLLQKITLYI